MKHITIVIGVLSGAAVALGSTRSRLDSNPARCAGHNALVRSGDQDSITQVSMRNVNFYVIPNAALRIRKTVAMVYGSLKRPSVTLRSV